MIIVEHVSRMNNRSVNLPSLIKDIQKMPLLAGDLKDVYNSVRICF